MPITTQTYGSLNPLLQKKPVTPTVSGVNGPGAQQMSSGAQRSAMPPTVPTVSPSAPAPTAAPAPAPTIGETLSGIRAQAETVQQGIDALRQQERRGTVTNPTYDTYPTYEELFPEIDQREIDRRQRRLFQGEIDATNRVYDDMLNTERLAGQGRLGTGRAIAARGGLLGSDFGEAQRSNIVGANQGAERAVQNERAAKIGVIMGTMRKAAADEYTEKRTARQQGAENYISYLASAQTRKENNRNLAARAILDAGMDISTMDPAEIEAIGKEANLTANEIIMAYNDLKKTQDAAASKLDLETRETEAGINKINNDIANSGFFELSEGQSRYDKNGNVIASKGKTYAPGTGASGAGTPINLTPDNKRGLLGGGWSESDIASIETDVRTNGLDAVIAQAKANGASTGQINSLKKAYGSTGESEQFLTKDYFKQLFGDAKLQEAAQEAGVISGGNDWMPFNEKGDTDAYLTQLESTVALYRQAGYTDQEILKMMQ